MMGNTLPPPAECPEGTPLYVLRELDVPGRGAFCAVYETVSLRMLENATEYRYRDAAHETSYADPCNVFADALTAHREAAVRNDGAADAARCECRRWVLETVSDKAAVWRNADTREREALSVEGRWSHVFCCECGSRMDSRGNVTPWSDD